LGQQSAEAIPRRRLNNYPHFLFFFVIFIIIPCEAVLKTRVVLSCPSKKRPKRPLFRQILIFSRLVVLKLARKAEFLAGAKGMMYENKIEIEHYCNRYSGWGGGGNCHRTVGSSIEYGFKSRY
jgi:hypothetical protein